jgi:hypothetical protein
MEVRVHGSGVSDELRTVVYHETERLAQALRRRINTIKVELYEVPGANQGGHCARCQVVVLFDDGSSLVQVDEEDDFEHSVTEAFVKILCKRRQYYSPRHN